MSLNDDTLLVADIGGTNARFAFCDPGSLELGAFATFPCAEFDSIGAVLAAYLATARARPRRVCMAVAGPVEDGAARMTNLPWSFSAEEIAAAAGAEEALLVNDFEALARALPALADDDLRRIGGGVAAPEGVKAALGPGTGLGVAALARCGEGWRPIPGEGGHVGFPAQTAEELALLARIRPDGGRVSVERVLSGPGLSDLHAALAGGAALPAPEVVKRARRGGDPAAEAAVGRFVAWLGRFAGDLALLYGARGGVYLGGGVAPAILDFLSDGRFREAFEAKGRLRAQVAAIPVFVILAKDAGLRGAALLLRDRRGADPA